MAGTRFRMSLSRLLTFGGLSAASGSALLYQTLVSEKTTARPLLESEPEVTTIGNNSSPPAHRSHWDDNWDMRDLKNLKQNLSEKVKLALNQGETKVKEKKDNRSVKTAGNENASSNTSKKESTEKEPTATRHLIFVRHGQYNQEEKNDKDRTLTELGRYKVLLSIMISGRSTQ